MLRTIVCGVSIVAVLCGPACSKETTATPPADSGPLQGSFQRAAFSVSGATAAVRNGTLYVTLANKPSDCATGVSPVVGTAVVDVQVPASAQTLGSHQLGAGDAPSVTVTTFSAGAGGALAQQTRTLRVGELYITELSDQVVSASLSVSESDVSLNGSFTAQRCSR
jgi:hypothetical protein